MLFRSSGTFDPSPLIGGQIVSADGKYSTYPAPGYTWAGIIPEVIQTNIYDYNIISTYANQPYKVAASCTGYQARNWSGINGTTVNFAIWGEASVYKSYSNNSSWSSDYRVVITFYYRITLLSGGFNQLSLPTVSWILMKL